MTTPAAQDASLDDIRREIDGIDDAIVDLLARRIAASGRVRQQKSVSGSLATSPIRPAREAAILRRLLERGGRTVGADLLVRLWRAILISSTLAQARLSLHLPRHLAGGIELRLKLRDQFTTTPVVEQESEAAALAALNHNPGDVAAVETSSGWADAFAEGAAGAARVIGVLPLLRQTAAPDMLIFGHAQALATGDDETVVVSSGRLPRDFLPVPVWQVKAGRHWVSGLPGFLTEHEGPLAGLLRSNAALGLKVAGRYPSPIEVRL